MKFRQVCCFFLLITLSCNDSGFSDLCPDNSPNNGFIGIRIKNVSDFDFKDVMFAPGRIVHAYCDIGAGQVSDYKRYNRAFIRGYLSIEIDGTIHKTIPVDYLGTPQLKNGRYTLSVDFKPDSADHLKLVQVITMDN